MLTFKKGIHPPSNKRTQHREIQPFPMPKTVYISLSQHIGAPTEMIVDQGAEVYAGMLIGKAKAYVCSNVFSSVSGVVKGSEYRMTPAGNSVLHIVIENDGLSSVRAMEPLFEETPEQVVTRLQDAGVVGMGGAAFPTHVKMHPEKPIDTLIINGAECEPYITCDYRMLIEHAEKVIEGAILLKKALQAACLIIAVEDNKPEAIAHLKEVAPEGVQISAVKTKYPQGAEKQLIYALTGRKVPEGGLPMDVGCLVNNVATAFASYRAVKNGVPLYERVVTIDGDAVEKTGNFLIGNGVTFQDIYEYCRGDKSPDMLARVIAGGPMMGFAQAGLDASTTKATSSILFLTKEQINTDAASDCINCARCANICPMNVMPMYVDACILTGDTEGAEKYGANACIECGSCAYVCPARRQLTQSCRLAKQLIKRAGGKKK